MPTQRTIYNLLCWIFLLSGHSAWAQTQHGAPNSARQLCNKAPITVTRLTTANDGQQPIPLCFQQPVRQPYWIRFVAATTGTIEFIIRPEQPNTDFDFVLYEGDPLAGGIELACDWTSPFQPTGIASNPFEFGVTPNIGILMMPVMVTAGQTYYLLIDNYSQNAAGFTITWGGTFKVHPYDADNSILDARSCEKAPLFDCDCLQGFESGTEQILYTANLPGFGATVENPHVYRFVACACVMDFDITINGPCTTGFGLEAQVLAVDPNNNCLPIPVVDIEQGAPGTPCQLTAQNLNVGDDYLLVIDGVYGASCPYRIDFTPLTPNPLGFTDTLYTPVEVFCEGDTIAFWTNPTQQVATCYWQVPPGFDTIPSAHDTLVIVADYNNGIPEQVCLLLSNGCHDQATICRTIVVLPDTTVEVSVGRCPDELPYHFNGQNITAYGTYTANLQTTTGCDSTVVLTLYELTHCDTSLCPSGSIMASDSCASAPLLCGNYLDGFCGHNFNATDTLLHDTWLRISACEDSLALAITVTNCARLSGVQVALYSGTCDSLALLGVTSTVAYGSLDTLKWAALPTDSILFLRVNGIAGDQCRYQINVVDGMGTGTPIPGTCVCTGGGITGPTTMCPGEQATFTLLPATCTITGGGVIGGNGEVCFPPGACPLPDTTELVPVWHFSSPFIQFVGDSTGYSVQVTADPMLAAFDTLIPVQVTITWEYPNPPIPDTLGYEVYCDCEGTPCSLSVTNVYSFNLTHTIIRESCSLTCIAPTCQAAGQTFNQPGTYVISNDPCLTHIVIVTQDMAPPGVFINGPEVVCAGPYPTTLNAVTQTPNATYRWSFSNSVGPVATVPSLPGDNWYFVTVTNTQNGCTAVSSIYIEGILPVQTILPDQDLCIVGSVMVGDVVYSTPGNYSIRLSQLENGCDSIVRFRLLRSSLTVVQEGLIGTLSCASPPIVHHGNTYALPGTYTKVVGCTQYQFTINFRLDTIQHGTIGKITCANPCISFLGQQWCQAGSFSVVDNCAVHYFNVQTGLDTIQHGTIGTITCANPCVAFLGQQWCQAGSFSVVDGCAVHYFNVQTWLDTIQDGTIGTITCANPCVAFLGQQWCQTGSFSVVDGCAVHYFNVQVELDTIHHGTIGTITCANPCLAFLGQQWCQSGSFSVVDNCAVHYFNVQTGLDTIQHGTIGTIACANPCVAFLGQQWCQAGSFSVVDNCSIHYFNVQMELDTIRHGTIGTITCVNPCISFLGQQWCQSGSFSVVDGCSIHYFNVQMELDTIQHGTIGTITCDNPCVAFLGQQWCEAGSFSVVDSCAVHYFNVEQNAKPPLIGPITYQCDSNGSNFTAQFQVSGSEPFLVNGVAFTGGAYQSASITSGTSMTWTVVAANGCSTSVTGIHVCPFICQTGLDTIQHGTIGTITCANPCISFLGQQWCQTGRFSVVDSCSIHYFNVQIGLDTIRHGTIGTITCANPCVAFLGQQWCEADSFSVVDSCSIHYFNVQMELDTIRHGTIGTITCTNPCITFLGQQWCQSGSFSVVDGCLIHYFNIQMELDTIQHGAIGTITCANPCVAFLGQQWCQAGSFSVVDSCAVHYFNVQQNTTPPLVGPITYQCASIGSNFTAQFQVSGSAPFLVNGVAFTGGGYQSASITSGTSMTWTVVAANGCSTSVTGTHVCPVICIDTPATLSTAPIRACVGQTPVQALVLTPPVVVPTHGVMFTLKSAGGTTLAYSASGLFDFDPALMQTDVTYLMEQWVGPLLPDGRVDIQSPCARASNAQPVVYQALPQAQIVGPSSVCTGASLTWEATGGATYTWSDGLTSAVRTISHDVPASLNYVVTVTNSSGCWTVVTQTLAVLSRPSVASLTVDSPSCQGEFDGQITDAVAIGGTPPYQWHLENGSAQDDPTWEGLGAGTYRIMVEDAHNCMTDTLVVLDEGVVLHVDIGSDRSVWHDVTTPMEAVVTGEAATIQWTTNPSGSIIRDSTKWHLMARQDMDVICTVMHANGCEATDQVHLTIRRDGQIYTPNAITADNTQQVDNQFFTIYAPVGWIDEIEHLVIYDRWGAFCWEGYGLPPNLPTAGWPGTLRGVQAAPAGVYIFVAEVRLSNGQRQTIKGDVTVVR
jgi:CHU_C Type IX secretion signal domain